MTRRSERVNELLREEISAIVQRDLKDPRLGGLISITSVEVSPDFRHARVFVSVMGSEEQQKSTFKALHAAEGFMRHELRLRLKALRTVPELVFKPDTSIARAAELTDLVRQAVRSDEELAQQAASPDPQPRSN
jgi:ribosome-binding factor A